MHYGFPQPSFSLALALLSLGLSGAVGCGDDPAPTVSITVTPDRLSSGGTTRADISVTDFELAAEDHAHVRAQASGHEAEGEHEHTGDIPRIGHYHIYLDSMETNPILMGHESSVELTVTASAGPHRLIVRLHNLDHTIIEPQITGEAAITIE